MKHKYFICSFLISIISPVSAPPAVAADEDLYEVVLVERIADELRGWCIDATGHQKDAIMVGGVHGHTCYTFEGRGPTEDQAFVLQDIQNKNRFRLAAFNHCLTLSAPEEDSWIALKPCDDRPEQGFQMEEDGRIISQMFPELCITLGTQTVPGGGAVPVHLLRVLRMQPCSKHMTGLQRWRLRNHKDW